MTEIIFSIVLFFSLIGMALILGRKIPQIALLPEVAPAPFHLKDMVSRVKSVSPFRKVSFEMLLQKMLSKTRILILKTDNKTSNWLQRLREKSQKSRFGENDTYWKDIKRSTKRGNLPR